MEGLAAVELVTAECIDWFIHRRIHSAIGDIPPAEHEADYYARHQPQPAAELNCHSFERVELDG